MCVCFCVCGWCVELGQQKKKTQDRRRHGARGAAPLFKPDTNLELQHVFLVVANLNTECVDVWGPRPTAAPVLFVPSDIDCHAGVVLCGCCDDVAVIFGIEAPWNTFDDAWLDSDRNGRISECYRCFFSWLLRNVCVMCFSPHLPEAASGRAVGLSCISLWIAVKAVVLYLHQVPLHPIGLPKIQGKIFQGKSLV